MIVFCFGDRRMAIEESVIFNLGSVSCSLEVKEVLDKAGIPQDELLRFHQLPPNPELQADHRQAITQREWICSSFELKQSGETVWIITDPQQKSTNLYLEP